MRAKKSLGQNFLKSKAVVREIISAANLKKTDTVLEIGPGKGILTEVLLEKAKKVIAVEIDPRLISYLKEKFAEEIKTKKLTLVESDILNFDPTNYKLAATQYKLVANIPYYITGKLVRKFLQSDYQPSKIVLLLQKEVAERIVARDDRESILSISIRVFGEPNYIKTVKKDVFSPQPKVDSAILHIDKISRDFFNPSTKLGARKIEEKDFFKLVRIGFSSKRKMLKNNLGISTKELEACKIKPNARAENLSLENWECLCKRLVS